MTDEPTEFQTADGQSTSKKLSMRATTPPSEVPGYRLSRFLGSGAFGQVWVGLDLNTGRDVAVKFYLHRGGVNWSLLSREVKNLVQLSTDRQVVQVLEVGWDADPPYYVMELINGGSLEDLLKKRPRLPVSEATEMFQEICVGLNHCHAKGVLHCDLKPANVLIGDDGNPRLADFGQSRLSHEQTPALGTLFYMAPEQADLNSAPNASWDVYAAGAIFYRMLTGDPPHREGKLIKNIDTEGSLPKRLQRYRESIQNCPPADDHLKVIGMDRSLGRIISTCLAADPADRYTNVQQILDDLDERERSRNRWPLLMLGLVGPLLILLATSFFGYRSIQKATERTKEALRTEAGGSNKLAASFAAQTLESEIKDYYDLVHDESTLNRFKSQLIKTLSDEVVSELLAEIGDAETPGDTHQNDELRKKFLAAEDVVKLTEILQARLAPYTESNSENGLPRLATMFVTDALGTIISIAYENPVSFEENSAGKNFCYRTYFHGGREDLDKDNVTIGDIEPLRQPRLSAAFSSTATRYWKVAVSTPIYLGEDRAKPDAVFVVTLNLGDFELLQSKQGANQVAVLVDARQGAARGMILQHPLYDSRRKQGIEVKEQSYQIESGLMDRLIRGGDVDYLDPIAKVPDGADYQGPWIAAMQPVMLPKSDNNRLEPAEPATQRSGSTKLEKADLLVLVQYRLETVMAPVTLMQWALLIEGASALASILVVMLVLWYFVRKVDQIENREPSQPKKNDPAPAETIAAP
ncbi:Serine/threonine-protein kinase PknL [Rubripirellula obstinata]|uniref:Serine/threonine-protein kinase PknL n=1 Tax=Rubripirellula obstinata TaxID=406547 RepID=A0A5B1CJZ5_9BACT|nr:serine/threonine-protein kinase [Rubripirellula obstinata]KAA1260049.1 Serine/threonine-protein kinase PknL [Rubripirellula obstinata]